MIFNVFLSLLLLASATATTCGTAPFKLDGSTTLSVFVADLVSAWNKLCPKNKGTALTASSSTVGATDVCSGAVDIGDLSRTFKTTEASGGPTQYTCLTGKKFKVLQVPVAYDGIVIAAAAGSDGAKCFTLLGSVGLSVAQVTAIFAGTAKKWSDVSSKCASSTIVTFGPDPTQGTYSTMKTFIGGVAPVSTAVIPEANVASTVISKNAAGYMPYASLLANKKSLVAVPIKSVAANSATIQAGTYPLKRSLYMAVSSASLANVKYFMQFVLSSTGQGIITKDNEVALTKADLATAVALVK